jgi:putative component of toxin-antitoxin plasmid stabilization module
MTKIRSLDLWSEFPISLNQSVTNSKTKRRLRIVAVTATGDWKRETRAGAGFGMRIVKVQRYHCIVE